MEAWLLATFFIGVLVLLSFFSFLFVKNYIRQDEKSIGTLISTAVSIGLVLFSLCLIPIDVYAISSSLTATGEQTDPSAINNAAKALKFIYYIVYGCILLCGFVILPYCYFYYEEELDEYDSSGSRAWRAAKYTTGFLVVFAILAICSFLIKEGNNDQDWKSRLAKDMSHLDRFVQFTIHMLALLGLPAFVLYGSYGLAVLPISMIRDRKSTLDSDKTALLLEQAELEEEYHVNQSQLAFENNRNSAKEGTVAARLAEKYGYKGRNTSDSTRATRQSSIRTTRKMRANQQKQAYLATQNNRWTKCWNALGPLRLIIGILLLGLSLIFAVQMAMSIADRILHSKCKWSCGFSIDNASLINPLDKMFVVFSDYFPLDLIVFTLLVLYLFICLVVGVSQLGVRIFFFKTYNLRPSGTPANALAMACWLLMFCGLVLNQTIVNNAPQYTAFGNQFYIANVDPTPTPDPEPQPEPEPEPEPTPDAYTTVSQPMLQLYAQVKPQEFVPFNTVTAEFQLQEAGVKKRCTLETSNVNDTCKLTQIAEFVYKINNSVPLFGVVNFFASCIFLGLFVIFFVYSFFKSNVSSGYVQSDDPDLPNYVPAYK